MKTIQKKKSNTKKNIYFKTIFTNQLKNYYSFKKRNKTL